METPSRRKKILVYKEFQIKVVSIYALILVLGLVLSSCLFYTLVLFRGETTIDSWRTYVQPLIYTNVFTSLLVTLLAVYVTSLISHRIAGPMYRFTKLLEQVAEGDLIIDTNLRRKDELVAFGRGMGTMAESLRSRINDVKQALVEVEQAAGPSPSSDLKQALEKLKSNVGVFRT